MTQVQVHDLYGLHNYDIIFDEAECLKIIHAPNGYGKTTILKMIKYIIDGQLTELREIPFKTFKMVFDEGIYVEVTKEKADLFYQLAQDQKVTGYEIKAEEISIPSDLALQLQKIQKAMPIYLIDANRLWIEKRKEQTHEAFLLPTVLVYAKELGEMMREALAQSNYRGQELDRSFPSRLLSRLKDPSTKVLSVDEIKEKLEHLEARRNLLEGAGLYSNLPVSALTSLEQIDDEMKKVLTLYIEDSYEKLSAFESLATKINLLCSLINKRFSYKEMEVNMKDGFVFRIPSHDVLKADKLSSGEQNELILMFKLLFKCPAHAMILMDEPEISLHIAWQQSFLEDMEAIAQLSHIRMMIATHSPDIINGRWDLTSGLEENACDLI